MTVDMYAARNAVSTVPGVVIVSYDALMSDTGDILESLAIAPEKVISVSVVPQPSAVPPTAVHVPRHRPVVEYAVEPGRLQDQVSRIVALHGADLIVIQEESSPGRSHRRVSSDAASALARTRRPVFVIPAGWEVAAIGAMLMVVDGCKRHSDLVSANVGRVSLLLSSATLVAGVSGARCRVLGHLQRGKGDQRSDDAQTAPQGRSADALVEARLIAEELKALGAHAWFASLAKQDASSVTDLARSARVSALCLAIHESELDSRRDNSYLLTKMLEGLHMPVLLLPAVAN